MEELWRLNLLINLQQETFKKMMEEHVSFHLPCFGHLSFMVFLFAFLIYTILINLL